MAGYRFVPLCVDALLLLRLLSSTPTSMPKKKASEKMQRLQKEKRGERGAGERGWGLV